MTLIKRNENIEYEYYTYKTQRLFQGLTNCEAIGESVFLQLIIQNLDSHTNLDLLNLL